MNFVNFPGIAPQKTADMLIWSEIVIRKHKINNIAENNEVRVLQLHQYVIQVGRREKQ